jgi:hypothetical protein
MKIFYTYLWLREDGTPYYVGKGSGKRAFTSKGHSVGKPKDVSYILIQEYPTEEDAFSAEKFLIEYYGRDSLRNMTDGGLGGISNRGKKHSPEHSRRISESLTGKPLSEAHRLKLSLAKLGKPSLKRGIPLTLEVRQKISKTLTGRKNPHSGHAVSLETRKKMSDSQRLRRSHE